MATVRKEIDPDLNCEVPRSDDPENVCGNGQDPENGIIVGYSPNSDTAICNLCLKEWYEDDDNTSLARRESQVVALKMLGRTHSQIADLFQNRFGDDAPKKATISSHSRRAQKKYFRAVRTAIELEPLYDPDIATGSEDEESEEIEADT